MTVSELLVFAGLLVANGFFVAVEFALLASRRTKLEAMAEAGSARARLAIGSMRNLNLQLAGAQLGVTMASLLLGYVAEPAVSGLIEDLLERVVELPEGVLHTVGFIVALTIVAFLHMVVGEMVPKNIAIAAPERTLMALAAPNRLYVTVFGPLLAVLTWLANAGTRLVGVEPRDELATAASAEELAVDARRVARRGAHRGRRPPDPHRRAAPAGPRAGERPRPARRGRLAAPHGHPRGGRGPRGRIGPHPPAGGRRGHRRRARVRPREGPAHDPGRIPAPPAAAPAGPAAARARPIARSSTTPCWPCSGHACSWRWWSTTPAGPSGSPRWRT